MEAQEILSVMVDMHNRLTEISVKGDDAIRMAEILQKSRACVFQLQNELQQKNQEAGKSKK